MSLRNELLDAGIDLNSSVIVQEHPGAIAVRAKLKPVRLLFGGLFALPCLYFLNYALTHPGTGALLSALLICPVLALMALLIGGTLASKTIDRQIGRATKSLSLMSLSTSESQPLPPAGTVILTWQWSKPGDQSTGYSQYTAKVTPAEGLVFTTINDYRTARAFADRLAALLNFPLEDTVPQRFRSSGKG